MRYSRSRISRLLNRVRPERWLRRLEPVPSPPSRATHPSVDGLSHLIQETVATASAAKRGSDRQGASLQEVIDHGKALLPLLKFLPLPEIEILSSDWGVMKDEVFAVRQSIEVTTADTDIISGSASMTASGTSIALSARVVELSQDTGFQVAFQNYIDVTSRPSLDDEVRQLLVSFGLDRESGESRSCLELFEIARQAYRSAVGDRNPAMTSLIPIRECIKAAIEELLRRRPIREPASSEKAKIMSIGRQMKRPGVADETVVRWADEWHRMNDEDLSGSKRPKMSREEWTARQVAATRYLHGLLTGLDPTKMRPYIG